MWGGMRSTRKVRILVCSDAGAAGRELLARRDVSLEWALTPEEAVAAVERRLPQVVLAREEFALTFLRVTRLRNVPVVVLLESDGWDRRDAYFDAGATVLVRASNRDRILEALSEVCGLPTPSYPRVPYADVLDVEIDGSHRLLESVELSPTSLTVRDFPAVPIGSTCKVTFVMMEPPVTVSALVTRHQPEVGGSITGLAFNAISDDERRTLLELIETKVRALDPLPDPVGLTADLSGSTYTLDLFTAMEGESDNDRYHEMLRNLLAAGDDLSMVKAPRWLKRVRRHMTELEERALASGQAPDYAMAALDMRIDLARSRAALMLEVPSPKEVELCLDFCRALAIDSVESDFNDLCQVAEIRAALLREIYGSVSAPDGQQTPATDVASRRDAPRDWS